MNRKMTVEQQAKVLNFSLWRLELTLRKVITKTRFCLVIIFTPIFLLIIDIISKIAQGMGW